MSGISIIIIISHKLAHIIINKTICETINRALKVWVRVRSYFIPHHQHIFSLHQNGLWDKKFLSSHCRNIFLGVVLKVKPIYDRMIIKSEAFLFNVRPFSGTESSFRLYKNAWIVLLFILNMLIFNFINNKFLSNIIIWLI